MDPVDPVDPVDLAGLADLVGLVGRADSTARADLVGLVPEDLVREGRVVAMAEEVRGMDRRTETPEVPRPCLSRPNKSA